MKLSIISCAFALAITACVSQAEPTSSVDGVYCHGHWHVDEASFALDPSARDKLEEAADVLGNFTGRTRVTFDSMPSTTCTLSLKDASYTHWEGKTIVGTYDVDSGNIDIRVSPGHAYRVVLLHELAHGLGVPHSAVGVPGVMSPGGSSFAFFTIGDHATCVAAKVCDGDYHAATSIAIDL